MLRSTFFVLFSSLLLFPAVVQAVVISEIMYAPSGDYGPFYNEWVELYNPSDSEEQLGNWILNGTISSTFIFPNNTNLPAKGFIIISKNLTRFNEVYSASCEKLIDNFSLGNNGDWIDIYSFSNNSYKSEASVNYKPEWGGNRTNRSLEKNSTGYFESSVLGGTPCYQNSIILTTTTSTTNTGLTTTTIPSQTTTSIRETTTTTLSIQDQQDFSGQQQTFGRWKFSSSEFDKAVFGDNKTISGSFYSGDGRFVKLSFVSYIFKPDWISIDSKGKILRSNLAEADTAQVFEMVGRNETLNFSIPLFLYENCNYIYPPGEYTARVRAYEYNRTRDWNPVAWKDFPVLIGDNPSCSEERGNITGTPFAKEQNRASGATGFSIFPIKDYNVVIAGAVILVSALLLKYRKKFTQQQYRSGTSEAKFPQAQNILPTTF
ncbi:MAG: lamin tail domain-containing protein [Candidatus Aenigmarchaeota archaeon]|nr:lamin tail domain-containing protein [Candidatus Aenigmarchaeota archaeon]